jgi:hypothetical protein
MALTAQMVTIDCEDPRKSAKVWAQAAGNRIAADHDGESVIVGPASGTGLRLGPQRVPEPRVGERRVHVDPVDDRPAGVVRQRRLGASAIASHSSPGFAGTVLADPERNEFCVSAPE